MLIPALVKIGEKRGQAGVTGRGLNTWAHVHVNDMADFYIVIYNAIVADSPAPGHGRKGYLLLWRKWSIPLSKPVHNRCC